MRYILIILTSFLLIFPGLTVNDPTVATSNSDEAVTTIDTVESLYSSLGLGNKLPLEIFRAGIEGYGKIEGRQKNIITIIDFTKPSSEERFFVLDLDKTELLYHCHVSHGKNSGENYAVSFSNKPGSHQSSYGFYLTENTYIGKNGYSLIIDGLEYGINDKAKERAIVVHGAAYSDPAIIKSAGRLGRSHGCPALPPQLAPEIINVIKEGSVMYIHTDIRQG